MNFIPRLCLFVSQQSLFLRVAPVVLPPSDERPSKSELYSLKQTAGWYIVVVVELRPEFYLLKLYACKRHMVVVYSASDRSSFEYAQYRLRRTAITVRILWITTSEFRTCGQHNSPKTTTTTTKSHNFLLLWNLFVLLWNYVVLVEILQLR